LKECGFVPILAAMELFAVAVGIISLLAIVAVPVWATWTTGREHRVTYSLLAAACAVAWLWLLVESV
jgi:Tfp pilus assembly protein FimT